MRVAHSRSCHAVWVRILARPTYNIIDNSVCISDKKEAPHKNSSKVRRQLTTRCWSFHLLKRLTHTTLQEDPKFFPINNFPYCDLVFGILSLCVAIFCKPITAECSSHKYFKKKKIN